MALELSIADQMSYQAQPAESSRPRILFGARILLAIAFVLALFIPLIGARFHWDPVASSENRVMARMPEKPKNFRQLNQYAELFLAYYRDHFGFRNTLIRSLSLARFHGGLSLDQGSGIILGKDGWLFYPSQARNFLADRNLDPFSSAQLDTWQHIFEQRYNFCAAHGIKYFVVIPPNKQTIYPELVPSEYSVVGPQSRLDQLIDRLHQTNSPVEIVDLRPALFAAKKSHRLYLKTDTHWNDYGAYASAPVILDAVNNLFPGQHLAPPPLSDFTLTQSTYSGDLAYFINLYYEYRETRDQFVGNPPYPNITKPDVPFAPMETPGRNSRGPALYMIHDSFAVYSLYQFLGPEFSRVCWEWTYSMNGQRVLNFKPDIVIDEFLERMLFAPPPADTPDVQSAQQR